MRLPHPACSQWFAAVMVSLALSLSVGQGAGAKPKSRGEKSSLTLPSRLDDRYFYLRASIGGEGPFNLILDTGASSLVVSPKVAERLRKKGILQNEGSRRIGSASGKFPMMKFGDVRDVRIGDLAVPEARTFISDMALASKVLGRTVDGYAGMQLFETGMLVLDYPHKKVRFERGELAVSQDTVAVPCDYVFYIPTIRMNVGGQMVTMEIDSGMDNNFEVPVKDHKYPFVAPPVTVSMSGTIDRVIETKRARLSTNVNWCGVTFERPIVGLSRTANGRIGREVLENFVVGLDQRRFKVFLTPATNGPITSKPEKGFGVGLLPDKKGLKVIGVIDNTDAKREGIRKGDYVTAINDTPAKEWSIQDLMNLHDAEMIEVQLRSRGTNRIQLKSTILIE